MIAKFRGAIGLHSRARAFASNLSFGQPAITDLGCRQNVLACSRVGGVSGMHSAASAADDGSFPVVMVGSGNVMFGELVESKSSVNRA